MKPDRRSLIAGDDRSRAACTPAGRLERLTARPEDSISRPFPDASPSPYPSSNMLYYSRIRLKGQAPKVLVRAALFGGGRGDPASWRWRPGPFRGLVRAHAASGSPTSGLEGAASDGAPPRGDGEAWRKAGKPRQAAGCQSEWPDITPPRVSEGQMGGLREGGQACQPDAAEACKTFRFG